jgi:hypothetical protein
LGEETGRVDEESMVNVCETVRIWVKILGVEELWRQKLR